MWKRDERSERDVGERVVEVFGRGCGELGEKKGKRGEGVGSDRGGDGID